MIRAGQRVIVIGPSGYGKTRYEMALLEGVQSAVIFDKKQDPDEWPSWGRAHGYVVTDDPADILRYPRVVLLVDDLWISDREGWKKPGSLGWNWTTACQYVFQRGDTVVVFTEGLELLPSNAGNPHARRLVSQGRSRRITSLTDVQVSNWTDTLFVRQSDHAIVFKVTAADVRILRDRGADPRPLLQLEKYAWAHHATGAPEWTCYEPLPKDRVWGGPERPQRPPKRSRRPAAGATPSPDPEEATGAA